MACLHPPIHPLPQPDWTKPQHINPPTHPPNHPTLQKKTPYYYGFNQDASCVAVGTSRGYAIYNTDPFRLWYVGTHPPTHLPTHPPTHSSSQHIRSSHEAVGGIASVEMLYCTSLLALVGAGDQEGFSPRCLKIWNTKRQVSRWVGGWVGE